MLSTLEDAKCFSECCCSRALQKQWLKGGGGWVGLGWWSLRTVCGLYEALECCGRRHDGFPVQSGEELREASAWLCGTGGGSGPRRGRPGGAMALSDSARFLAAGLGPARWLPGSEEGRKGALVNC